MMVVGVVVGVVKRKPSTVGNNTQHQARGVCLCAREKQKHGGKRKRKKGGGRIDFLG